MDSFLESLPGPTEPMLAARSLDYLKMILQACEETLMQGAGQAGWGQVLDRFCEGLLCATEPVPAAWAVAGRCRLLRLWPRPQGAGQERGVQGTGARPRAPVCRGVRFASGDACFPPQHLNCKRLTQTPLIRWKDYHVHKPSEKYSSCLQLSLAATQCMYLRAIM